jgi:hypothetical protein
MLFVNSTKPGMSLKLLHSSHSCSTCLRPTKLINLVDGEISDIASRVDCSRGSGNIPLPLGIGARGHAALVTGISGGPHRVRHGASGLRSVLSSSWMAFMDGLSDLAEVFFSMKTVKNLSGLGE